MEEQIAAWGLLPHPEGGFYRETYRNPVRVRLPDGRERSAATAIFFLLRAGEFSAWHTVGQDELWHGYLGGPLTLYKLNSDGKLQTFSLGPDFAKGQVPQVLIPAGTLQAAACPPDVPFVLVGCTVSPGFEFEDLYMPSRAELLPRFPLHAELIRTLTRH